MKKINKATLYLSPRVREVLEKMNNDISNQILKFDGCKISEDMTYIDIYFNYSSNLKFRKWDTANKLIIEKWFLNRDLSTIKFEYDKATTDYIFKELLDNDRTGLNSIRIGKFINKILDIKRSSSEIEYFINEFKSHSNLDYTFELISGEDIKHCYDTNNYVNKQSSSLWKSCMSDKKGLFNIYIDNPDSCQILILKNKKNKILGRAIVWKLNSIENEDGSKLDIEYFMDRVYSVEDFHVNLFYNYAENMNWSTRSYNTSCGEHIRHGEKKYYYVNMSVKTKKKEYRKYPYLDSFFSYDSRSGLLYNTSSKKRHSLRGTDGTYTRGISRLSIVLNRIKYFISNYG